jgi:hypothetical protein
MKGRQPMANLVSWGLPGVHLYKYKTDLISEWKRLRIASIALVAVARAVMAFLHNLLECSDSAVCEAECSLLSIVSLAKVAPM